MIRKTNLNKNKGGRRHEGMERNRVIRIGDIVWTGGNQTVVLKGCKEWLVKRAIHRYLKRHYPKYRKRIIERAEKIRPKLMAKAPDLGGRENSLSNNLNMFILFLSYYEATNHRMGGEAIDEIIDAVNFISSENKTSLANFLLFKYRPVYLS